MTTYPFIRCPCCGGWSGMAAMMRGVSHGHALQQARPAGRGRPWTIVALPDHARRIFVKLLRDTADRLADEPIPHQQVAPALAAPSTPTKPKGSKPPRGQHA